ncbi:hypothetical protein PHYSODRAFT_305427 [Phytophthora sojae]|uniref:Uncharacterized protein n=1 Tax=Phytophthora sojae (strain P6497) TaxID=1094619 RepID=G5A3F1_PHYSP|nr:hypothetical protein PHYSODRAFT_305427 [Phytophthora sojae]EGZ10167.1 hypothetical protein PHYSODRAFT_305427 [Phytophthora sojae]|eukprot:XP_009535028.1 hypothetical protein PHYSODRAFT_305427 [Phytophthora sojae]
MKTPIVPSSRIPKKVIAAMVAAGAKKEELDGEDIRILRVESVHSEAWGVYERWAASLGDVSPLMIAHSSPPAEIRGTRRCPPREIAIELQFDATSIINHFADGIPAGPVEPHPDPAAMINVRHPKVAVTALISAICCPGPTFPVINGLELGQYICHVQYVWRGALVTVPVFRTGS